MKKTIDSKKWGLATLFTTLAVLVLVAAVVIIIDPFWHYHGPSFNLQYPLNDERYMNDGIARHSDYGAIITGSSTSQNFKVSQFEKLFGTPTIKQTYAGGNYHEISKGIERALKYNDDVEYVMWGLDLTRLNSDPFMDSYEGIPTYLYDNNIFNDVNYLFNLDVLKKCVNVINYTRSGQKTLTMDDYAAWYPWATYGRENVLSGLLDYEDSYSEFVLSDEDYARLYANCNENIIKLALDNPDVTFYVFYTPSSAVFWYGMYRTNQLNAQIDAEKYFTSLLLDVPNVKLYGFADRTDITTDLDLYMDTLHYSPEISEKIIELICKGEGELTQDNYETYYENIKYIYTNYPYDYE